MLATNSVQPVPEVGAKTTVHLTDLEKWVLAKIKCSGGISPTKLQIYGDSEEPRIETDPAAKSLMIKGIIYLQDGENGRCDRYKPKDIVWQLGL
jgi:hypothetical protein